MADFAAIAYLVSGVMFILALRGLSSPETSRRGNILGMTGMALAVVVTLSVAGIGDGLTWGMIIAGVAIGGTAGAIIARRIPMTAMPQLVAALHSFVGLAAVFIGLNADIMLTSVTAIKEAGTAMGDADLTGFGEKRIAIEKVFPPDSEQFRDVDLAKADISVKVINEQKGFQYAMSVFAGVAAFLFIVTFATTKERVSPPKGQKTSLGRDIGDLLTNAPWLILFALGIITLFHVCLRNGAIMYYFKYNVGNTKIAPLFMLTGTFANLISLFTVGWLERKFGKKKGYAALMFITMALTFAFYFVPESNMLLLFIVHVLINFTFGPTAALVWAMYTDAADYSEWRTGRRATGLVMSACTMAQKFGYTLGGALGMALLTYIGYQANAVQTDEALAGIKGLVSWMSAIPCAIGFVLILFYPLTERKLTIIEADLKARRKGQSDTPGEVS